MDMYRGKDSEIVMDIKDYIREKCGSEIADHVEKCVDFYKWVCDCYDTIWNKIDADTTDEQLRELDIEFASCVQGELY